MEDRGPTYSGLSQVSGGRRVAPDCLPVSRKAASLQCSGNLPNMLPFYFGCLFMTIHIPPSTSMGMLPLCFFSPTERVLLCSLVLQTHLRLIHVVEIGGRLHGLDDLTCFLWLNRVPKMVDIM